MALANPAGLLAGLLAVPLVAWYVLRVRRPAVTIASTFLWARAERSVAAAVPWQRFRSDLTFWLILAAILLGTLALAQPYVRVAAQLGDHTILIVDTSASMLADEAGPSRLELARREGASLVDRLGPGQAMSVVEAGSRSRVLLSSSSDPGAIRAALSSVRPTHGPPDLVDAFTLAAALERPGQTTVVHLLTDGVLPPDAVEAAPDGLLITAVGEERPNLAVTRLQAVPTGTGSSQVFVQVRNFGTLETSGQLALHVDDTTVVEQRVTLGPRASEEVVLDVDGGAGGVLRAEVSPTGRDLTGVDAADALSVDDAAYTVLSAPRELDVLLAGPGNVFLRAALGSIPGATVTTAAVVPGSLEGVDLLVVDRVAAPDAPDVPTLYVAPTAVPPGVEVTGTVELPALSFQAPDHELLADVDLSQVAIAEAQAVAAPGLATLAGGTDGPLLLAGRLDGAPAVYVAFDLLHSNLPLQPAWPILVANATTWLTGPPAAQPATAGATVTVPVPIGATDATVHPPSGAPAPLDPSAPRLTVDQVGLWRVTYTGERDLPAHVLAVNAAPAEGDLARPQPAPATEEEAAEAGRRAGAAEGRRPFGRALALAVLVLALGEWAWTALIRPRRARRGRGRQREAVGAGVA